MKAILEFNLPEDSHDHLVAVRSRDLANILWDVDQQLRNWQKYDHNFETADAVIDRLRELLHSWVEEQDMAGVVFG